MLKSASLFDPISSLQCADCRIPNLNGVHLEPRGTADYSVDTRTVIALAVLCGALGLVLVCWTGWYCFCKPTCQPKSPLMDEEEQLEFWDPGDFAYAEQDWPQLATDLTPSPLPLQVGAPYPSRAPFYANSRWSLSTESLDRAPPWAERATCGADEDDASPSSSLRYYPSSQDEYDKYDAEAYYFLDRASRTMEVPEIPRRSSKRRSRHHRRSSIRSHTRLPTISEVYAFDFGFPRTHVPAPATYQFPDVHTQPTHHMLRHVHRHSNLTVTTRPESRLR